MLRLYAEDLHYLGETEKERPRDSAYRGRRGLFRPLFRVQGSGLIFRGANRGLYAGCSRKDR